MFENQKFHVKLYGDISNKKNMVIFNVEKKGLLSPKDLTARLKFANKCKKLPTDFWTESKSFYLDGTSWVHKSNLASHAETFRTRTWRKRSQGTGMLRKGKEI